MDFNVRLRAAKAPRQNVFRSGRCKSVPYTLAPGAGILACSSHSIHFIEAALNREH